MRVRKHKRLRGDMLVLFVLTAVAFLLVAILFISLVTTGTDTNVSEEQSSDLHVSQTQPVDGDYSEQYDSTSANALDQLYDTAYVEDIPLEQYAVDLIVTESATEMQIISINDTDPELTYLLDEESKSHTTAAASLVIFDANDGLFFTYHYGYADIDAGRPVDVNTTFRSASLSKLVVAVCAMVLVDEGRLDIDEDISVYLGFQVRNPNFPGVPITARMLMQHTSTILDSEAFNDSLFGRERVSTENLLGRSSSYWDVRPGTRFQYSNFGFSVLGAVIEMIAGERLDAFARRVVFEPLGIDAAFYIPNLADHSNIAVLYDAGHGIVRSVERQLELAQERGLGQDQNLAQGSLMISALDYAKILAMLGNGGELFGVRILSADAVREIHEPNVEGWGYYHGLSTRLGVGDLMPYDAFFWHTGSAHGVFAQNVYTVVGDYGYGGFDRARGAVVITTGATTGRYDNGMISVCTHLIQIAWRGLGFVTE